MKTITPALVLSSLLFFLFSPGSHGVPVPVPDLALEAAIEAQIGDNSIPGTVDSAWLSGEDGDAGVYTGASGGITTLGIEGDTLFTLSDVHDLTGLEHAHNLSVFFLRESPVPSLAPIVHLKALTALAFHSCALNDAHLQELLETEASLTSFGLINGADSELLKNRISENQLSLLLKRHILVQRLALVNMGLSLEPALLAGAPVLADPPCRKEFYLSGNKIISLEEMSLLYDVRLLDMASCGITDTLLAQADWSRLACLDKALNLSENEITAIEPLRGLITVDADKPSPTIDLRGNRLDATSIHEHIPALKQAGYELIFDMELFLEVEGIGDLPPAAGSSWHPFGASIFRTARPRPDSNQGFVGWRGDVASEQYDTTVEMTDHRHLTAVFSETPAPGRKFYPLTIVTSGAGRGGVLPLQGRSLYRDGETIGLSAVPEPGSYFGGWQIVYTGRDEDNIKSERTTFEPYSEAKMNCNITATAHFETTGQLLTLDQTGRGALSLASGTYPLAHGATLQLRALPAEGWRLGRWEDGQGNTSYAPEGDADPSYTLSLVEDRTVYAVFEEAVRTLTITIETTQNATGSTTPSGDVAGQQHSCSYGDQVTITAFPANSDSAFAGWSGDLPEDMKGTRLLLPELAVSMAKDRKITATFVPAETRLFLDATLDAENYLPSAGSMAPVPGAYGFVRDPDNQIALQAFLLPDSAAAFAGWAGDLQDKTWASSLTETIPMDRDRTITAVFQTEDTCKLTLVKQGNGVVNPVPGVYTIVPGQQLSFNATAQEDSCFGGWRVQCQNGVDRAVLISELSLIVTGDTEITAHFGAAQHTVWIGATQEGGVLTPPPGVYRVPDQTVLDLEATPPEGSMFYHWSNKEDEVLFREPTVRITVAEDSIFNAVFGPPGYRVQAKTTGTGSGSVALSPESESIRPENSLVELRAIPDDGSVFVRWEGELPAGISVTQPTVTLSLRQDVNVTAVFDKVDYYLTVVAEGVPANMEARIIPPPGVYGYLEGSDATFFAAPPPGSGLAFVGWENGEAHTPNPEVKFLMDGNRQVVARFAPADAVDSVKLDILRSEGDGTGMLEPLLPGAYHFLRGAAINFSCDVQAGSYFGGFTGEVTDEINYHNRLVVLQDDTRIGIRLTQTGAILNLGLNGDQGGMVSPPPGLYRFSHDIDLVLTATRTGPQWVFRGWYDGLDRLISPYGRHRFRVPSGITEMTIIGVFYEHIEMTPIQYCCRFDGCNDAQPHLWYIKGQEFKRFLVPAVLL